MKAGEWTLRSRRVVTPSGTRAADVLIRRETIVEFLEYDGPTTEGVILDVGDLAVLPGLVAMHREPPGTLDGELATREFAIGGVTTLIGLPSAQEAGSSPSSGLLERMAVGEGKIRVDRGLVVLLGWGKADRVESWVEAGVLGVEASFAGRDLASLEDDLLASMPILAKLDRPLLAEPGASFEAVRLLIRLCRRTGCRVHLIRPSSPEALSMIAGARSEGLPITVEALDDPSSLEDRDRPWDGLKAGRIDALGVAPSASPGPSSGGVGLGVIESTSLRLALAKAWTEARARGFTLDDVGRWLAGAPARAIGLDRRKGAIVVGLDADFVVFDPDAPPVAASSAPGGLSGRVEATILRGALLYEGGRFYDNPRGSLLLRLEETQPIPGTDA